MNALQHAETVSIVDDFLANQTSLSTIVVYEHEIKIFLDFIQKSLKKIDSRDLLKYRKSISAFAPATIARKLSTIRSLFTFMINVGYILKNPSLILKSPKVMNISSYKVLDEDETSCLPAGQLVIR